MRRSSKCYRHQKIEIGEWLSELESPEAYRRATAAKALGELEEITGPLARRLEEVAQNDANPYVREAAVSALQAPAHRSYVTIALPEVSEVPISSPPAAAPKQMSPATAMIVGALWGSILLGCADVVYISLPRTPCEDGMCGITVPIFAAFGGVVGGIAGLAVGWERAGRRI